MSETKDLVHDRYGIDVNVASVMNDTLRTLLSHRTCREFTNQPVGDDVLNLLFNCAQSAPTKSNLQQYSIVNVRDPDLRQRMGALVPTMDWLSTAPIALVFLGDVRRIRQLAKVRGHDYKNNNIDTFMNGAVDAAVAMQNLIVAAESIGLGACPVSYVRNRLDDLADILSLPDGVFPICTLTLGYPISEIRETSLRLPQEIVVHQDQYDDGNLSSVIGSYDDRAHARAPLPAGKQRHTDKYGVLEKCTWSENVARQLSEPERAEFNNYLKRKNIRLD